MAHELAAKAGSVDHFGPGWSSRIQVLRQQINNTCGGWSFNSSGE